MSTFADRVRGPALAQTPGFRQPGCTDSASPTDNIEADLVEVISLQHSNATLHPTRATPDEILPEGYSRSYGGFLLRQDSRIINVDQKMVRREMEYLSRHVLLAFFVGRPS